MVANSDILVLVESPSAFSANVAGINFLFLNTTGAKLAGLPECVVHAFSYRKIGIDAY
jgi:hypothetical protein